MTDMQENTRKHSFLPSSLRKRAVLIYVAVIVLFYVLHITFLGYESKLPQSKEFLTSHDWVWYYPVLGFVSVLLMFSLAKIIGFGLKRKTNYWEGR